MPHDNHVVGLACVSEDVLAVLREAAASKVAIERC